MKKAKQPWYKIWWVWAIVAVVLLIGLIGNTTGQQPISTVPAPSNSISMETSEPAPETTDGPALGPSASPSEPVSEGPPIEVFGELTVHFIDVGQADAMFIELPNQQTMLIDAGNNEDGETVVQYIRNEGYSRIDYVIATHPHEDHIGGMDDVIRSFDVGAVYMPGKTHTTRTFEDVLMAIVSKDLEISPAKAGVSILDTLNLDIDILAPNSGSYEDLNDYSAVVRLVYNDASFLFMGDAEEVSENEIAADVDVDVLKVGHHGSNSSTSSSFLGRVTPVYAVICVGAGNTYGHPTQATLDKLTAAGAKIYRTDLDGTIIITTDGKTYRVETGKAQPQPVVQTEPAESKSEGSEEVKPSPTAEKGDSDDDVIVYITKTGKKYHQEWCRHLSKSKKAITLKQAKKKYGPCKECNPPE